MNPSNVHIEPSSSSSAITAHHGKRKADGSESSLNSIHDESSSHPQPTKKQKRGTQAASAAPTASPSPDPEFFYQDGLRYIVPYEYEMKAFVKKRWWGAPLLTMLRCEYKNPIPNYYDLLLASGRISIQPAKQTAKPITNPEVLRSRLIIQNDQVCIRMHRHEPPVYAGVKLQILHCVEPSDPSAVAAVSPSSSKSLSSQVETIVVNKPSGMPVHASGRYLWNTVVGVLKMEHGIDAIPVHRLDRVTSGLLLLSLTRSNAISLGKEFMERLVSKSYVARVRGAFPEGEQIVTSNLQLRGDGEAARKRKESPGPTLNESPESSAPNGTSELSTSSVPASSVFSVAASSIQPSNPFMSPRVPARISAASTTNEPQTATSSTEDTSKTASTSFTRISFDGATSLIRCRPLTGRTHQIRAHLASIGFPIANDYLYGGQLYESNTYRDHAHEVMRSRGVEWHEGCAECDEGRRETHAVDRGAGPSDHSFTPPTADASSCAVVSTSSAIPSATAPPSPVYCSHIWLHCYSYSGPNWSYEAPMPDWAQDSFDSAAAMAKPVVQATLTVDEEEVKNGQ